MKWERWVFAVALAAGATLRLPQLDLRPMHTDEAVHAVKFGALLETGTYRYDRNEYHGPTLNYLTLLPALLVSEKSLPELTEQTLRIVPAVFGLVTILFFLLVVDIGTGPAAIGALLTACSPAMVFYSRYYIQETLLVCFAFGLIAAGHRLVSGGRISWSLAAGGFAGLMFATKETWVISFGAIALALVAVILVRRREGRPVHSVRIRSVLAGLLCGAVVSVLLYSSFFTHWQGVTDSLLAYSTYFGRAGEDVRHGHPWYYFLQILAFSQSEHGPAWTEAGILLFGLLGIGRTFAERIGVRRRENDLKLFIGIYALLMFLIVSAIPYKTPWLILGALQPLTLMAGCGVYDFLQWLPRRLLAPGTMAVAIMAGHLGWQSYMADFRYYDDPGNPYVYSQPTEDVRLIGDALKRVAQIVPEGVAVQVVVPGNDYWPLPWYLRSLHRVGWWDRIADDFIPTPVILVSPESESALLDRLYDRPPAGVRHLYVPLFERPMFLRPGKEVRGYVTLELWNRIRKEGPG
jgi:uncharacterized protein (TIGR03663 family)